ncbi:hypothetical protein [Amaricoccus sp.]|uniref:hypothetical protein n=1 Tax=Amaricoccus sp. TaxID=1872485 RepID=UPI001B5A68FA|nr:hypothetical protein [Amaricoccus sp.]MBP7241436.1 hypothetical protein [Amaricoccus sp.]
MTRGAAAQGAAFLLLAACAAPEPPAPGAPAGPPNPAGAQACQAAVAAHVGKPVDAVAVDWLETRDDAVETFEALDGTRRHTCDVDAAGQVLRIEHPEA